MLHNVRYKALLAQDVQPLCGMLCSDFSETAWFHNSRNAYTGGQLGVILFERNNPGIYPMM